MATTTTTTTTTATVGGGTTVDNLNILDTSKTNDLGSLEIITWADVAAALGSTTNATQTQTIQSAFTNGQLNLTFQLAANVYYTIDHTAAGYMIIQTDQYGFQSGQFDAYTNQTVSLATSPVPLPTPLQSPTISLSTFLTNVGSFLGQASALITADLDGGSGKDVIQGIVGDGSLSTGSIHNIIQGGTGADVLTGGSGSDFFVYTSAADSAAIGQPNPSGGLAQTWDQITNFTGVNTAGSTAANQDKIDFGKLIADPTASITAQSLGLTKLFWLQGLSQKRRPHAGRCLFRLVDQRRIRWVVRFRGYERGRKSRSEDRPCGIPDTKSRRLCRCGEYDRRDFDQCANSSG